VFFSFFFFFFLPLLCFFAGEATAHRGTRHMPKFPPHFNTPETAGPADRAWRCSFLATTTHWELPLRDTVSQQRGRGGGRGRRAGSTVGHEILGRRRASRPAERWAPLAAGHTPLNGRCTEKLLMPSAT